MPQFSKSVFSEVRSRRVSLGFTLIEVMIVVAVIAILAAIALPAYNEQVNRGKRADCKAFVMDIASRLERFNTRFLSYTNVIEAPTGCSEADCGLGLGGLTSPEGHCSVAIGGLTPSGCSPSGTSCTTYTITATRSSADPTCLTLTLDHLSQRGSTGTGTLEECWR